MYRREEDDEIRAYYEPAAQFFQPSPKFCVPLVEALLRATGLPRSAESYPTDIPTLQATAVALQAAVKKLFNKTLDLDSNDPNQLDVFIDAHLAKKLGFIPREPLLMYALGAFWGEWQVRHRHAAWALFDPLNPLQDFPDMVMAGATICSHPFSQVLKKCGDPEADNLAFKVKDNARIRFLPKFPLLASLADADEAVKFLLPAGAREAMEAFEGGDAARAMQLFDAVAERDDAHPQMLSLMTRCAWDLEQWEEVIGLSLRTLELVPENAPTCHNLAVLYSNRPSLLDDAIELLERALQNDPDYAPAHLTMASCQLEAGRLDEARRHATWVLEHDEQLAPDAQAVLDTLNAQ